MDYQKACVPYRRAIMRGTAPEAPVKVAEGFKVATTGHRLERAIFTHEQVKRFLPLQQVIGEHR